MPFTAKRLESRGEGARSEGDDRRSRGSTAVYAELREDILSLRIAPGTPLDELALARRFGLSRTPIREALVMLSSELLVRFLPSRSAIVAPHTMANNSQYLDVLILHACAVGRICAQNCTADGLRAIRDLQKRYDEASRDPNAVSEIVAADLAFHKGVADAGGNAFLSDFYALTLDYGRRMMIIHYYPRFDAVEAAKSRREHAELVRAIERGEDKKAEDLAARHVRSCVKIIQNSLEPSRASGSWSAVVTAMGQHA